ncbi:hypothetical protein BDV96DRAFT_605679 [Lophiotrema nucula]|uniref:SH3 domain-containing protein n=1 Tax=Lophiotrema nucula TaxID=690887 RepID=A0A6A5YMK3_9PLEO|nr:hypothetical protein BDV96DRAFT_605679 [Lophiotrema nucula]
MAHEHGRMHLVRRQLDARAHHHHHRKDQQEEENNGVATVVQTVIQTMPKTFSGDAVWVTQAPQTLVGDPIQNSPSSKISKKADTSSKEEKKSSAKATATKESATSEITRPATSPKHVASTIMVATSSPVATGAAIAAATASGTAPSSSTATAEASSSSGMSGGAKAGLALGLLLGIGAVLGLVLFLYHRKKKQVATQKAVDDEKAAMQNAPPPPPRDVVATSTPSIRTARTASTAPRLSLRPVTQFSPTFENRKSGGNLLAVAAAGGPTRGRDVSPERPSSSWERPGAVNASAAPANPFNDPNAEISPVGPPEQNPFGNHAATDRQFAPSPSPPPTGRLPTPPSGHLNDFANPAPAIAAAEAAQPVGMAAVPITRKQLPTPTPQVIDAPPTINFDGVPPSPAWTEDIPASPGPAPTGPPPVAAAGGKSGGPSAAPVNNVHRVQLDFKPSMNDELGLRGGQLVRMLHEYDDGWALCIRMDRSQQGVVPRTCLSKHPVKPRTGPPRQPPPANRPRGPPMGPMGPGGIPQPRPLTPTNGRQSPHPPSLGPVNGRMSPGPRSMSPGPRSMAPNMGPPGGRARSNSNAPYAGPPRSMSPGPYGGGPQQNMPPPQMQRPRSNSASQVMARRNSPPGPSPMNPNANPNAPAQMQMPSRKPVPGLAL